MRSSGSTDSDAAQWRTLASLEMGRLRSPGSQHLTTWLTLLPPSCALFAMHSGVTCLAFAGSNGLLCSGRDGQVCCLDPSSGAVKRRFRGSKHAVSGAAASPGAARACGCSCGCMGLGKGCQMSRLCV